MDKPRTISVDFDGVIHSYISGWTGPVPTDPPLPGAFDFIRTLVADPRLNIVIFSTRSQAEGGVGATKAWFLEHGLEEAVLNRLEFPLEKPDAKIFLDDRGWNFKGTFPIVEELLAFEPWHKQRGMAAAMKYIKQMQLKDRGAFPMDIGTCARCGEDHEEVAVQPLTNTSEFGPTHYVLCPNNNEPIMVTLALDDNDDEVVEPPQEH